jgi:subtilisin
MSRRVLAVLLLSVLLGAALVAAGPGASAAPSASGNYIVVFKDSVADPAVLAASQTSKLGATLRYMYKVALNGYAATIPTSRLADLTSDPSVAYVAADVPVAAAEQILTPNLDRVDGELSSTVSGDGTGSVNLNVAVLDTGIDPTQPDLNVVGGYNCSNGKSYADANPAHGTGVAGVIAAKDDGFGVVGVAPGARLWAVRVLNDNGHGSTSTVLCGIDWVTATRTDSDPSNDIAVANMSIGGKGSDDGNCGLTKKDPLHQAICRSVAAGVTYAVAAGNEGTDIAEDFPAAYDEVLVATAMTDTDGQPGGAGPDQIFFGALCPSSTGLVQDDSAAYFSNFATTSADQAHTVAAPGVCIITDNLTTRHGGLALWSGTSFASPHVAGVAALCIASGPCAGLTPAQIMEKLVSDASTYNTANPGYGFAGDPLRPQTGKYYGYLVRAGLY